MRPVDVDTVIYWGDESYTAGALRHVASQRAIRRAAAAGVNLAHLRGVTVIATLQGLAITVYRRRRSIP